MTARRSAGKVSGMPDMTPRQALADHILEGRLAQYVTDRRRRGDSWRRISLDLRDDTGVDVTHQTLSNWYGADESAGAA